MSWLSKVGSKVVDFVTGNPASPNNLVGSVVGGGILGKYQSDLDQQMAYEMADKNWDISQKAFDLQKQENLEAFNRNKDLSVEMWERQKSYNLEQWEREKAYNLDLWQKEKEYNSPAAQIQRLKEAGLNPNLMYGQGTTGNVGGSDSAHLDDATLAGAEYSPARLDAPTATTPQGGQFMRGIGALADYVGIRNANLETNVLKLDALSRAADVNIKNENLRYLRYENDMFIKSGTFKRDPSFWNIGGRVAQVISNMLNEWRYNSGTDELEKSQEDFRRRFTAGSHGVGNPKLRIAQGW